jgi:hypothetical protein
MCRIKQNLSLRLSDHIFYAFLIYLMHATRHAYLILLYLINVKITGMEDKLWTTFRPKFPPSFIDQLIYGLLLCPGLFFSSIIFFTQTVGLLGQHRHRCLEWDSNPRSQRSSDRHFLLQRPTCFYYSPVLTHSRSMFYISCVRLSFTPIRSHGDNYKFLWSVEVSPS